MKKVITIPVLLLAMACSNKEASKSGNPSAVVAADKVPRESKVAYALGRKVSLLEMYVLVNKPEKASATLEEVNTYAIGLGIPAVAMPHKGDRLDRQVHDQLAAKTTLRVAETFSLGHAITFAWFGAEIGASTVPEAVADIETGAKQAGVPESVWRAQYDKIKAHPSADEIDALGEILHAYFKS